MTPSISRKTTRLILRTLLPSVLCLTLVGCASGPSGVSAEEAAYRSGAYDRALVIASAKAPRSVEARLIAGMSAQALGRTDQATSFLSPLSNNSRKGIRSRANATLGLIELERGRNAEAAALLRRAANELERRDASRARELASSIDGRNVGTTAVQTGDWTIQVGAYTSASNARMQADRLRAIAAQAGLNAPHVSNQSRRGSNLYTVGVGRFRTEQEAQRSLDRLGVVGIVKRDRG